MVCSHTHVSVRGERAECSPAHAIKPAVARPFMLPPGVARLRSSGEPHWGFETFGTFKCFGRVFFWSDLQLSGQNQAAHVFSSSKGRALALGLSHASQDVRPWIWSSALKKKISYVKDLWHDTEQTINLWTCSLISEMGILKPASEGRSWNKWGEMSYIKHPDSAWHIVDASFVQPTLMALLTICLHCARSWK
jgi:hypothetical protein